jgi:hypothetical protein
LQSSPNKTGWIRRRLAPVVSLAVVLGWASYAYATGWPPFIRDDSLTVFAGGSASVLDNGATSVLANDFDFERDPMTAILTREPKRGIIDLNPDGTFVYRHTDVDDDEDDDKKDEFRYRAFDGTGYSREAKVRITIRPAPNNPPIVTGQPPAQEATAGSRYRLELAGYFTDPDESDELTFSASGLPGGRRLEINPATGVLSGTPADQDARDNAYNVTITARDRRGASASLRFALTIIEEPRADLLVTATVATNPVTVGETARWNVTAENIGPGRLEDGEVQVQWLGSGSSLSLTVPERCLLEGNGSRSPFVRCQLGSLRGGDEESFLIEVTQNTGGDYSLVAVALSDDPVPGNNAYVGGGQVVAEFSDGPLQVVSVAADVVTGGDLNGDGQFDVVAPSADGTLVYMNDGDRSLRTPGTSLGSGSGGSVAVVLDWNFDGSPDIAVAGTNNVEARVYLNDGSGLFSKGADIRVSGLGQVLAAGGADLDGDGNEDLVIAGSSDAVAVLSEGGSGYSTRSLPGNGALDLAVADLDNDADQDIVLVASGDRSVRLLSNAGDGRNFSQTSLSRGSVAGISASDLNGDNSVDLLLAVDGADLEPPESRILLQQFDGSFPDGLRIGASPLNKLIAGDVDGDQLKDIIAINDAGVHQLYRARPGGGFELEPEQIVSDGVRRGMLVDVTDDESLDLILAGRLAGVLEVYANDGRGKLGLGDRVAPTIVLNGAETVTLASGQEYVEEGATATDNIDGDISSQVTIIGTVNSTVVGTYTLTYTASDRAGNSATTVRKIQVGVNQGTGGAGGGTISPLLVLLLLVAAARRRRWQA